MLLPLVGSTALGISMLRHRAGPPAARVLLAGAVPGFLLVSTVGGHNAVGMVAVFAAWAVVAWSVLRAGAPQAVNHALGPVAMSDRRATSLTDTGIVGPTDVTASAGRS